MVEVVSDTLSATKTTLAERPGWQTATEMIAASTADLVIVYHLDRLTRSMRDLEDVIDSGIEVGCATGDVDLSSDAGRLVGRILGAVARGEVERKSARQVLANEQRAEAGRPMWVRRPFGYERDGSVREAEAALVRRAYTDLLRGTSLSAIRRDFEASGIPTTIGGAWTLSSVRVLLRAPRNAGLSSYHGEVVAEATWQAIVSEATWRAADRLLGNPERHSGAGPLANLLSGIAVCDQCGGTVKVWKRKSGQRHYACAHGHASLPVEFADDLAVWHLIRRAERVEWKPQEVADIAPLREEEAALRDRLAILGEDYAAGDIDRATMQAGSRKLRERLAEVEAEIAKAGRVDAIAGVDIEYLADSWDGLSLDDRRAIVRSAFESIRIKSRGKGRVAPTREHMPVKFAPEWR